MHVGSTVTPSPIPGVGKDYLELSVQAEKDAVELIGMPCACIFRPHNTHLNTSVGYIFMNIMRRTRFDLPKYEFPLLDDESEQAKQSMIELIRYIRASLKRRPSLRNEHQHIWKGVETNHVSCNA